MEGDSNFSLQVLLGRWCAWLVVFIQLMNEIISDVVGMWAVAATTAPCICLAFSQRSLIQQKA